MVSFAGLLDSTIYAFAPSWGAQRRATRQQYEFGAEMAKRIMSREREQHSHHEGASQDRLKGNWIGSELSPDSGLEMDLETLRSRSAELVRDDGYAAGAIEGIVNDVIGTGITVQSRIRRTKASASKPSGAIAKAAPLRRELEETYQEWAEKCGADGCSLWELQRRAVRAWAEEGEAFLVFSIDPIRGLIIEQVAACRVETPPQQLRNKNIRMGIECDRAGLPLAYHIRTDRPDDTDGPETKHERVLADRVVHLWEKREDGQRRGKPWFTPVLNRMKAAADLTHAEFVAQKIATCFAAFIKTNGDSRKMADEASTPGRGRRIEKIQPGMIKYLGAGEEITFGTPSNRAGAFAPAHEILMRGVCAGLNIPYEKFVKDWSKLTYSGGRLALIEAWTTVECRQQLVKTRLVRETWERHVQMAVLMGLVDIDPRDYVAQPRLYTRHKSHAPARPWVDPEKDVKSSTLAVEGDLSTKDDELATRGKDAREVIVRNAKNEAFKQRVRKKLGIVEATPPSTPTPGPKPKLGKSAKPTSQPPAAEENDEDEDQQSAAA